MKQKINLVTILTILLIVPKTYVKAEIKRPTIHFESGTTIKYLTDEDKNQIADKFALSDYDGAVIITNNAEFRYLMDYSNMDDVPDNDEGMTYEEIINSEEKIDTVNGYVCAGLGMGYSEYVLNDVRRENNELSFGLMYGAVGDFATCARTQDHNLQSNLTTYTFDAEGLFVESLYYTETGSIHKMLVYYIEDMNNSKLNFKSTNTVTSISLSATTDMTKEPYTNKKFDLKTRVGEFRPEYYGVLNDNDREKIMDMTYMSHSNGIMTLTQPEGFSFIIDFDNSTIKENDITALQVTYYSITRENGEIVYQDEYTEEYRYAHGYELTTDSNYNPVITNTSIKKGIKIKGKNELEISPNYVIIRIYSLDNDGWRGLMTAYDTEENRNLLNFESIEELKYNETEYQKGDMNKDGEIGLQDIIYLLKRYLNVEVTTEEDKIIGDMNEDGEIGLQDIILLLRVYLGVD